MRRLLYRGGGNITRVSLKNIIEMDQSDPSILSVQVLDQSDQFIHCEVHSKCGGPPFLATFVYGASSFLNRQALWSSLHRLSSPLPWIVMGDFNAIRFTSEKVGGHLSLASSYE